MAKVGRHLHQFTELLHIIADGAREGSQLKHRHIGPITGVITSVDDPQNKGRVQVALDYTGGEYITPEWVNIVGGHGGRQPRSLVNTKVLLAAIDGSPYEYIIYDILDGHPGTNTITPDGEYDVNFDLSFNKTGLKDRTPISSVTGTMKRLPVYSTLVDGNYIPTCHGLNLGVQIMLDDGNNTTLLTCQRVKGGFSWTRSDQLKFVFGE
jgi:Type VI secretion system/phage-baseplate injector OB domain